MLEISDKLAACLHVVKKYEWLLNSFVLDFFIDEHWSKLPKNWQQCLEQLPTEKLAKLLQSADDASGDSPVVWPLELLALRQTLRTLCINRTPLEQLELSLPACPLLEHPKLKYQFMQRVKPKKAHEIRKMAAICARSCQKIAVDFVVDFGAGVGHLARVLGYGYGIKVCCFEMQAALNAQALAIDAKLESMAGKFINASEKVNFKRPEHLTQRLNSDTTPEHFIASIRAALQLANENFQFGIIGLHPCGDLGPTLMRMFLNCKQAKFLNFVGCCYQKMSTKETYAKLKVHGYPLSSFLRQQLEQKEENSQLSYESREVACHAVEFYCDRLRAGQYEYLKIHSLRAAAERIIVQQYPDLRHCALRNVKHMPGMSFQDYFKKAVEGTRFADLDSKPFSKQTDTDLLQWRNIVCFYTLRLMLAPCVESIILYDRAMYLLESGCEVNIEAIFDPRISPRNHITSAVKTST